MNLRTLLSVLLLGATISHAHVDDVVYPIYELPTADLPDLHDGRLEDWESTVPGASLCIMGEVAERWCAGTDAVVDTQGADSRPRATWLQVVWG